MPGIKFDIIADNSHFIKSFNETRAAIHSTKKEIESTGLSIDQIFTNLKQAAGALTVGFSAQQFIRQIVQVRGEFQQLEVAFKTMLGSEEKANSLMQNLTRTAAITPFDLQGVANGAKQLLAYGIAADEVNDTLVHLGDIAAGLSLPLNDLVYLYGTTMVQGRMFTQDLRQFQGRGIPIAEELAKQFGVTKDKVGELVTAGKVGAEEFKKAIMSMSSEGGKFGGLMEEQSKTIIWQISNIEDAIDVMFNNIGKQSEGIINGTLSVVSSLVENYQRVGEVIGSVVATYGAYKAAVMTVTAIQALQTAGVGALTAAETVHYGWLVLVEKAQKLLNSTMLANPYVLAATAVAGLVAIMVTMKSQQDLVNEAQEEYNRKKEEAIAKEEEHKRKIEELIRIAGNESLSTDTRREAILKLKKEYPDLFVKYNTEIEALKDIAYWKAKIAGIESGKSITLVKNELEDVNRQIAELEARAKANYEAYMKLSPQEKRYATPSLTREEAARLTQLRNTRDKLNEQEQKAAAENYLKDLTGVSNEELKRQISERRNLIARIEMQEQEGKKNVKGRVVHGGATGLYDKAELRDQLQTMEWEQNRRKQLIDDQAKDFMKEATKAYNAEKTALQKLESLTDPDKRAKSKLEIGDKKVSDMGSDEFLAAIEKQQKAVDEAKKKVDAYNKARNGGSASTSKQDSAAKEDAARRERVFEQELSDRERQAKQLEAMKDAQTAAAIANEQNRARRELMQIEKDHDDALAAIDRQAEEMRKANYEAQKKAWEAANTDKTKSWSDTATAKDVEANGYANIQLTQEHMSTLKALRDKENADYGRRLKERAEQERQYLLDYIKEYGSIQAQKEAITKEYDQKIAEEGNTIQRAALEKQREQALEALNFKEWQQSINWEDVFNDLERQSSTALSDLKDKLRAALTSGDVSAENAKVLAEKIREIEDLLAQRKDPFAAWLPGLRERLRLTNQVKEAEAEISALQAKRDKAQAKVDESASGLLAQLSKIGFGEGAANAMQDYVSMGKTNDEILKAWNITKPSQELVDALDTLRLSTLDLTETQEGLNNAEGRRKSKQGDLDSFLKGGDIAQYFKAITDGLDIAGWASLVNNNVQSMSDLVDNIGLGSTEFGQGVHEFAEGVCGFNSAIQSLQSGDVIGAINGIVDGLQGFGSMVERIGGFSFNGSNAAEINKQLSRLSSRNEILTQSIDRLNDTMSNSGGSKAIEQYAKIAELQKELEDNLAAQVRLQMEYHNAHHSFNKEWEGFTQQQIDAFNRLNDLNWDGNLNNINADIAAALMADADMWQSIENTGKGGYGERVAEKIAALAEQAGVAKAQVDALNASLTAGTTVDSVFDDFLSSLYDLADGSDDVMDNIAQNWQKMVNRMVVNNLIGEDFRESLESWYTELADLNKRRQGYNADGSLIYGLDANGKPITGMTDEEYRRELEWLQSIYNVKVDEAQQKVEQFTEMGIIKPIEEAADKTLITIDEIRSGWMNMLLDTKSDTEDWAQDIAKIMTEQLADELIFNDEWNERQQEWLDRYKAVMEDEKLTAAQKKAMLDQLKKEQQEEIEKARRDMKAITDMTGYDPESASRQSASVQTMERITVDQADELIGRMNAGQMTWEQGNELSRQIARNLTAMQDVITGGTRSLGELVTLQQTANGHLSLIKNACEGMRTEFADKMDDMYRIMNEKL